MQFVRQSFILLNNSIWVVNLALNTKRNENKKEDSSEVVVPINAPIFFISLEGAILLSYAELRLPTWLIVKPKLLHISNKLPSHTKLWLNHFINLLKLNF